MASSHAINGLFSGCIVVVAVIAFLWLWLVVEVASSFPKGFIGILHGCIKVVVIGC